MNRNHLLGFIGLSLVAACASELSNPDADSTTQAISGPTDRLAAPLASSFATTHFFYKNRFGWEGYDGDDNENEVYTNTTDPTAYNVNWIGDELFKFKDSQVALDVVGHEYTHGVIDHKCDLDSGGEPGALNESFADLMGNVVEGNLPSQIVQAAERSECATWHGDTQDIALDGNGVDDPGGLDE